MVRETAVVACTVAATVAVLAASVGTQEERSARADEVVVVRAAVAKAASTVAAARAAVEGLADAWAAGDWAAGAGAAALVATAQRAACAAIASHPATMGAVGQE